jgi:hypothetical protein
MKVRWTFKFEYQDLKFEKTYQYKATITKEDAEKFGLPAQEFDAEINIEPEEEKHGAVNQRGEIHILLPGNNEQTKDLAYSLADSLTQHITFSLGKIVINWSFVSNELIGETPEEIAELGENRFSWTMSVVEVPDKTSFSEFSLQKLTNNKYIKQFNEANNANNPIDRFIGLFKILEDLYGLTPLKPAFIKPTKKKGKKQDLKPSLKSSDELNQIALQNIKIENNGKIRPINQAEFEKLVDDLVDTRHECAHLRSSTGFGITYGDARIKSEVEPLLVALETLAFEAVQKTLSDS